MIEAFFIVMERGAAEVRCSTAQPMDNCSLVVLGMWLRADIIHRWSSARRWFRWKSKSWIEIIFMIDAMLMSNATRWNNHIVPVIHFPIFSLWFSVRLIWSRSFVMLSWSSRRRRRHIEISSKFSRPFALFATKSYLLEPVAVNFDDLITNFFWFRT